MSYNSGSVIANVLNTSATQKTITFISTNQENGTGSPYTIGTVGAGKRWTIISIVHSVNCLSATVSTSKVLLDGQVATNHRCEGTATIPIHDSQVLLFNYDTAPVLSATKAITLTVDAAGTRNAVTIGYIEESV
jgi:hypothetical protein